MDNPEFNSIQATGKSVDEAIFKGLQQMGTSIDEVTIEIIQTETKGILGIGAKPAIVRLTQRSMEEFDVPDYMRRSERNDRRDDRRREKEGRRPEKDDRRREKPAEKEPVKAEKPAKPARTEKPEKAEKPEKPVRPEKPAKVRPEKPAREEKPAKEAKPAEKEPVKAEKPVREEEAAPEKRERAPRSERPAGVELYGKIEDLSQIPGISAEQAEADFEKEIRERRERSERRPRRDRRGERGQRRERPAFRPEEIEDELPEEPAFEPEAAEPGKVINYTLEAAQGCSAAEFVQGLIEHMGAKGQVLAAQDEDCLRLRIDSDEMGMLIGHRGETLDAMQYLTGLVVNKNRKTDGYTRVTLNTEEYREKREETLKRLARKVAGQVRATGRARALEPMNPYERRVLHSALQNHPDVTTHSEGEEPNRRVVVTPRRKSGFSRSRNYRRANRKGNASYNAASAENNVENIAENNENRVDEAAVSAE